MAPTPTPRSGKDHSTTPKTTTPHSKHRLNFPKTPNPSSAFAPTTPAGSVVPTEHPVEVIGRIREHPPDIQKPNRPSFSSSALNVSEDGRSLRVTTDIGYRDFSLDGVSLAVSEDLSGFYAKFIRSRILDVRTGAKCTVMMYGPTGSGKSHTMFGCGKQPGIVYMALKDILTSGVDTTSDDDDDEHLSDEVGLFVQVAVLEIYNEEIYDLLPSSSSAIGSTPGLPKGATPKAKLEVMGKKAKNASYITGNDAGKISREVAKVEKRRIVKSTLCNDRSSRSHCMIILEVPSVGGRLMLVDMAGSENIEQAGQSGFDAKMQTAKINQGNTALKRVVESIANGDSHVPFRDSKLTMLLQDSFEDSRSKILMILCASPDPKELHKTVSTLEYGAKAKCIVRLAKIEATPRGEKSLGVDGGGVGVLGSTIAAMNQFICKLQMENRAKDKEREAVRKELTQKETEVGQLREKLKSVEEKETAAKENEINSIVNEKTVFLRSELQKLEEKMSEQQHELQVLRRLLADAENISDKTSDKDEQSSISSRFLNCFEPEGRMDQSMELDFGGDLPAVLDVKEVVEDTVTTACLKPLSGLQSSSAELLPPKFYLSTVFEEEEEEPTEEIEKEVVEEKNNLRQQMVTVPDTGLIRNTRIQNIFRLCGNYREIAQHKRITPEPAKSEDNEKEMGDKENSQPEEAVGGDDGGKERGKLDPVDSGNCCYLTTNVII